MSQTTAVTLHEVSPIHSGHEEGPDLRNLGRGPAVLTLKDVAEVLQCSKTHVSNLINGKVPGVPKLTHFALGRRKVVRREWLEEWIEANKCK